MSSLLKLFGISMFLIVLLLSPQVVDALEAHRLSPDETATFHNFSKLGLCDTAFLPIRSPGSNSPSFLVLEAFFLFDSWFSQALVHSLKNWRLIQLHLLRSRPNVEWREAGINEIQQYESPASNLCRSHSPPVHSFTNAHSLAISRERSINLWSTHVRWLDNALI